MSRWVSVQSVPNLMSCPQRVSTNQALPDTDCQVKMANQPLAGPDLPDCRGWPGPECYDTTESSNAPVQPLSSSSDLLRTDGGWLNCDCS